MGLKFGNLFFLINFLLLTPIVRNIIVVVDDVALISLEVIQQIVLLLAARPHLFSQGLELESDIIDVIINLFLELGQH